MSSAPIKPGEVITAEFLNRRLTGSAAAPNRRVLGGSGNLAGATTSGVAVRAANRRQRTSNIVIVKIDSPRTDEGSRYDGHIYRGGASIADWGTAEPPFGMTESGACIIINLMEEGQPTHWLLSEQYIEGVIVGVDTTGGGSAGTVPLVVVNRGEARTGSAESMGSNAERTTAATDTFDRTRETSGDDYGDTPLILWVCTGVYYDHGAGTPELKAHMRPMTFAADGKLHSIGAETDYIIDTPEEC